VFVSIILLFPQTCTKKQSGVSNFVKVDNFVAGGHEGERGVFAVERGFLHTDDTDRTDDHGLFLESSRKIAIFVKNAVKMTVLELNAKKAELVKSILNDVNSEEVLDKVSTYVKSLVTPMPCQYTSEEIVTGALQAIEEAEKGGGVLVSEIKRKTA